jgi:hypothetical protein
MNALVIAIIVLLTVVTVVIFIAVIAASVLVTVAVRREERLKTLGRRAPGRVAELARMLLAVSAPRKADQFFPRREPARKPEWYERTSGMR